MNLKGGMDIFGIFSQIHAMALLISPERIERESCACAQIEAHDKGIRWLYFDDAGDSSERGRNAANLISDGGGHFCLFFSNWCSGSANTF